jgi:hypothetical protein
LIAPIYLPNYRIYGKVSIAHDLSPQNQWAPTSLPFATGTHVIESLISSQDTEHIPLFTRQNPNTVLAYVANSHLKHLTMEALQDLVSHGCMVPDNIINIFLEILGAFQNHKALFVYVHKPQSFCLCCHKHLCGDIICATWLAPNCR